MKKVFRRIFGCVSFLVIFAGLFYLVDQTLKFKYADGILTIEDMYHYPDNSMDVLLVGSSHVGVNVDTIQLNKEYGIASYNLWGSIQPPWNSYFYLKEALKTQKPKVVVLENFVFAQDYEYSDYSRVLKHTLGMKWSRDKWDAIMVSAEEELRMDVLLGFSTYHSRYTDLSDKDFNHYAWDYELQDITNNNGTNIIPLEPADVGGVTDLAPLNPKIEEYLYKIIDLCQANDIPLFMMTTPYCIDESEQERFNTINEIAEKNDIPYINFNLCYEDYDIDYATDFVDNSGHLNEDGVEKFTNIIGTYLKENYELPERFNDPWFDRKPITEAVYVLDEPFVGDGEELYIDTKQRIFDDPKTSWTILSQIGTVCEGDNKIYFSCFSEAEPYRGLMVRQDGETLYVVVGDNYYIEREIPRGSTATLAIVKDKNTYSVAVNGEWVAQGKTSACDRYEGTLLIGCQESDMMTPMRFSKSTVQQFELYDKVLSGSDIMNWMFEREAQLTKEEKLAILKEQYTGDLNYTLEDEFKGDGATAFVNTGVQLYAEPERDWTMLIDMNTEVKSGDGVFASCFCEDEGEYRGVLVRKDAGVLHIIIGDNYYVEAKAFDDANAEIAISKKGNVYNVYVDGICIARDIELECEPYWGETYIGCQEDDNLNRFRYSEVTVNRFEITDKVLSVGEIQRW